MRKTLLLLTIITFGLVTCLFYYKEIKQRQRILESTVMISMTTANWQQRGGNSDEVLPIPNEEYRTIARAEGELMAEGLGTLLAIEGEVLLVTHDHWSMIDEALGNVTFRAADGTLLANMDLRTFKEHIRYRDGGLMVLKAPEMLANTQAAEATNLRASEIKIGDVVFYTQRAGDGIKLTRARVLDQRLKGNRPVLRLQSVDGQAVKGGDSGGGVWINGRLAATMWTTVMMEYPEKGQRQETNVSVAALYSAH